MKNVCELCQLYSPSGCAKLSNEPCLKEAVQLLKDSVTNGDMFVAVFKPYKLVVHSAQVQVYLTEQKWQMFGIGWWNAPYKADSEEE